MSIQTTNAIKCFICGSGSDAPFFEAGSTHNETFIRQKTQRSCDDFDRIPLEDKYKYEMECPEGFNGCMLNVGGESIYLASQLENEFQTSHKEWHSCTRQQEQFQHTFMSFQQAWCEHALNWRWMTAKPSTKCIIATVTVPCAMERMLKASSRNLAISTITRKKRKMNSSTRKKLLVQMSAMTTMTSIWRQRVQTLTLEQQSLSGQCRRHLYHHQLAQLSLSIHVEIFWCYSLFVT